MAANQDRVGPASYRNWREHDAGVPPFGWWEVPLYSDARVTGEIVDGLGPFRLANALPVDARDPAAVLVVASHLGPNQLLSMQKTNTENFTGASLADEVASLTSLSLGARFMAGGMTRSQFHGGVIISGDRERPVTFPHRSNRGSILPAVQKEVRLVAGLIATLPTLQPQAATSLLRAARSYRDALWIAEVEPELAWLLLVSALEVAAIHRKIEKTSPLEILRESKPDLVQRLAAVDPALAEDVSLALARELRATARFLDFAEHYMPPPPDARPPEGFRLDWSPKHMKRCMLKVYEHRSRALHEGIPFPPPMCMGPMSGDSSWPAPIETVPGLAASTGGGAWLREDTPFALHTFEYVARGMLMNWWAELAGASAPAASPPPAQ